MDYYYGLLSQVKHYTKSEIVSIKKSLLKVGKQCLNTASKKLILRTSEATGDFIGNKITEEITKAATKNNQEDPEKQTTQILQKISIPEEI